MKAKALLDTNILLDAAMSERPGWEAATLLLDEVAYGSLEACIAATSLKDAYYVLAKYMGEEAAREYVEAAMDAFHLVPVDEAVCRSAIESEEPDFEDGIVRACAESVGADFIISRDEGVFLKANVRKLSAREYVDLFCETEEVEI